MLVPQKKKYFFISCLLHSFILFALIAGFDFNTPLPVIENTDKHDVISAVVLGDSAKSKILPKVKAEIPKLEPKPEPKPEPQPEKKLVKATPIKKTEPEPIKKEVIALKKDDHKEAIKQKKLADSFRNELLKKDLLSEIKKEHEKQKKLNQKQLQSQFAKTLREQTEKSLRQQLLNEEITLQGSQVRQSQGEINKYKALIIQAISEHWVIPSQANKKLYCELMIRLAPGGVVLDVQITKNSGDPSLDSSARAAVLKASPLPVPPNANDFDAFRQFVLKVKPENILDQA